MLLFSISTILFGSVCGAVVVSHFIVQVSQKYTEHSLVLSINCCLKLLLFSLILACGLLPFSPEQQLPHSHGML
jgi:ethanolamine transporter EutH